MIFLKSHNTSILDIEGLPLKQFIQKQLEKYPKQDIKDILNKISPLYPKNLQEIRTTIGRCAKSWISDNSKHIDRKNVANSLEKFQSGFKTSPTKMKLLKDILANKEIEKCKQNYTENSLIEKMENDKKKTVNQHTINTTISRMKRIIKHRIKNPSADFDNLKLIAKKTLSKSALNMILATPIKEIKKNYYLSFWINLSTTISLNELNEE